MTPAGPGSAPSASVAAPAPDVLRTRRGDLRLPLFVPDATRAVVRGTAADVLISAGLEAVLVSSVHLAAQPGTSVIASLGGVHRFMGWGGPIVSDSGGFQVFSLLASRQGLASVSDNGLSYRFSPKQRFRQLTPASCIENQLRLGAEIIYCLDYCTHPNAPAAEQDRSVELTLNWAAQCRATFDRLTADVPPAERPLLFAVVQGGSDEPRRTRCAQALAEIGFDGYGFGGYPIVGGQMVDEVALVASLVPAGSILHGLGIGTPENVVAAWRAGYRLFDCTLPTRNARRGVLYTDLDPASLDGRDLYRIARLDAERWVRCGGPVDPTCDCRLCTTVPAAYLAHLLKVEDGLAVNLATLHNLRFYARLIETLRQA